jgi:hypothetical protein
MKLTAHQAIYGDVNGAHVLIAKSAEARSPFFELTPRTDRPPGHLPPNIQWQPYVSGYAFEDWYVLTRTFQDDKASRAGMVITHALVFNLEQFIAVNDLNSPLLLLPTTATRNSSLIPLELDVADEPSPLANPLGLDMVIRLLLHDSTPTKPVVWVGQEGFEPIVAALWHGLWRAARRTFKFRLAFTPQDLEGQELTIVATPSQMENRWSGFPVARPVDIAGPQTMAEAFLMGNSEGEPVRVLLAELEIEPVALGDLEKLEASSEYLESIKKGTISINGARSLVRLLGALSQSADHGVTTKAAALRTLMDLTANGSAADIQALNNLDLRPFKSGVKVLKQAISSWFEQFATLDDTKSAEATADMLIMSFATNSSPWTIAIHGSLKNTLNKWSERAAAVVWMWWQRSPSLVASLEGFIPDSEQAQVDLAIRCPHKLDEQFAEKARAFAKARGWLVLHAAVVAAYLSPSEAFQKQLEIDTDPHYFDGLRLLSGNEPTPSIVTTAVETSDPRLMRIAGEACYADPELLADFDVQDQAWRTIWFYSIEAGNPPWNGIGNPRHTMDEIAGLLIDGVDIDHLLLRDLSKTELADLSKHRRRAELWDKLDASSKDAFLNATADGWLRKLEVDPALEESVEPALEGAILSPARIERYLSKVIDNIEVFIDAFRRFPRLTAAQFETQLRAAVSSRSINSVDATLIGRLIKERSWRGAATTLSRATLSGNRQDLIPAVQECQGLLGWVDQFQLWMSGKLSGVQISSHDWWNALEETAIELYSHGPGHVWQHAGGDESLINRNQGGQAQWREALNLLRKGGGGKNINPKNLLDVMCHEYGHNQKLQVLKESLRRHWQQ